MTGAGSARMPALRRCGDTGWLLELADNEEVHRWAAGVRAAAVPGVLEVVPGLTTVLVTLDPAVTSPATVRSRLEELRPPVTVPGGRRSHLIEVRYDGEDLPEVARLTGLSRAEVVQAHTGTPWRVAFCGFAPGFAYLTGGDPRLQVPRRPEARIQVPAGAVAVAGLFSAVYPRMSPGGWQLLGRTAATLWDQTADPPAVLLPGDLVEFRDLER